MVLKWNTLVLTVDERCSPNNATDKVKAICNEQQGLSTINVAEFPVLKYSSSAMPKPSMGWAGAHQRLGRYDADYVR